ncbi:hypothetical protein SAMN06265784_11322 [Paraburkholderia susongensis]|uniref:Uncharacterized protein n=1 Tax=Paraburkholderia susongensis TaxID=1515439 RepID=A0A1X7M0X3_9BURK|nr:hypothetical protein SAMN06265784_11322 [Paraburkholderia susongensis]
MRKRGGGRENSKHSPPSTAPAPSFRYTITNR